jgi:hypothetical protein
MNNQLIVNILSIFLSLDKVLPLTTALLTADCVRPSNLVILTQLSPSLLTDR